jgi:hypothetical protein
LTTSVKQIARAELADLTPQQTEQVLGSDVSACLAFVDAKGYPRQLPCWFLWYEGAFYITSTADKFHVRRLQTDGRASICVEVTEVTPLKRANRQVKGVGQIEVFPDEEGAWGRRIQQKYLGEVQAPISGLGPVRVVLRMQPDRLIAHGGGIFLSDDEAGNRESGVQA